MASVHLYISPPLTNKITLKRLQYIIIIIIIFFINISFTSQYICTHLLGVLSYHIPYSQRLMSFSFWISTAVSHDDADNIHLETDAVAFCQLLCLTLLFRHNVSVCIRNTSVLVPESSIYYNLRKHMHSKSTGKLGNTFINLTTPVQQTLTHNDQRNPVSNTNDNGY